MPASVAHNTFASLLSQHPTMAEYLHNQFQIDGILFGIAAAPEIPLPTQWFSWLFRAPPTSVSDNFIDALMDSAMAQMKQHLNQMRTANPLLPSDCKLPVDLTADNPLSEWTLGVLQAHQRLESLWQQSWDVLQQKKPDAVSAQQKQLRHALSMLTTFADIPLAIEQAEKRGVANFHDKLPQLYLSLEGALQDYVEVSGVMVEHLPDQFETFAAKPE